jgi:hypothetical protein
MATRPRNPELDPMEGDVLTLFNGETYEITQRTPRMVTGYRTWPTGGRTWFNLWLRSGWMTLAKGGVITPGMEHACD